MPTGIEEEARELKLFTENDGDLYRQMTLSILKNLRTKQAQGKYDHERAVQAFMYLAEAGARKYAREHGSGEKDWNLIFPIAARRLAAAEWRDEFEQESALGNYDSFLPKKYQEPARRIPTKSSRVGRDSSHDGAELAQRVASNLSEEEVERVVLLGSDPPGRRRGPVFKTAYLRRMLEILNATRGS